jgi:hypothetical protein
MRQNETRKAANLTKKQLQALPYLVASPTMADAAKIAEVSRATLYRWMEDPEFREEYERLGEAANAVVRTEMNGLMLKAAAVFSQGMDESFNESRLRAAQAMMEARDKLNRDFHDKRLVDLMSRIADALEEKLA